MKTIRTIISYIHTYAFGRSLSKRSLTALVCFSLLSLVACEAAKTEAAKTTPTVATYTVQFVSNAPGVTIKEQYISSGARVVEPSTPIRTGYTFDGWYTDNDTFKIKYAFTNPVTKSFSLYAKWIMGVPTTYTVTFVTGVDGLNVNPQTVNQGSVAAEPTAPVRDSHTLDGWYTDNNTFNNKYVFSTAVTANLTLYAKWTLKTYQVQFVTGVDGLTVAP